jgi:hypothetical protein
MAQPQPKPVEGEIQKPAGRSLAKRKPAEIAQFPDNPDPWLATVERLAPIIGVEGVKEMMTLRREERANQAKRDYNTAMSECQGALETVTKNARNDHTSSSYANLAALAEKAMPAVHEHGFGVSFNEVPPRRENCVGIGVEVTHAGGHSERYQFDVPFGGQGIKGNINMTPTHAYGSALTYGRRYALCAIFNIATRDDDGNAAGGRGRPSQQSMAGGSEVISEEQEKILKALIMKTRTNIDGYLKVIGAESLSDIRAVNFEIAKNFLTAKLRSM